MNKGFLSFILALCMGLILINCANRGRPEGGPKDETPPVIIKALPKNYTTNFDGNVIKISFDEFVKIKDLTKQLIISPPLKTQPLITPMGSASKNITIKIYDTLQPNTTYAFNFGNSITDNNEGNPYPYYRYVFSTGDYIDSLKLNGTIIDALKRKPENFISVGLYEIDSTFNDSVVYKQPPKYITNTLDSLTTFSIENIKAGKYMLMALKDNNGDNKFQQKTDQIAFYNSFIDVPTDSLYTLKLFSEALDFKATRPKQISGEKIIFGYEGDYKEMQIAIASKTSDTFVSRITKDKNADTLYYWYKPKLEVDSLLFKVSKGTYEKDFTVRIRDMERDSLQISASPSGTIGYDEAFKITGSTPLISFDYSKITNLDKYSVTVNFAPKIDMITNTYALNCNKTEGNSYKLQILPEAFVDFFDDRNDTLNFSVSTKKEADFGYVRFTLNNATYPLILQLTNDKGEMKYEKYSEKQETLDFYNLDSGKYFIRVIFDANGNKKYDTGNYLKKIQPERVVHFQMDDNVRPNWGIIQTLNFIE